MSFQTNSTFSGSAKRITLVLSLASMATVALGGSYANVTTRAPMCENGFIYQFPESIRIVVGVTCVLSMIGALIVIFSYIVIREIRSKAREILINLSVMDFVTAGANFVGIMLHFNHKAWTRGSIEFNLCLAQASFGMYSTLASVLWTICMAVYVFLRIMFVNFKVARRSVYAIYLICYGIPLIMTLWFALTGKLGLDRYGGSGWCSLILFDGKAFHPLNVVFGNDMWIYLTIILVPLIFISLHFYLRYQVNYYMLV